MAKNRNPKVMVDLGTETSNPYKKGTAKWYLMNWALETKEFTKEEFLAAHKEIFEERKIESAMTLEVCGKAWWNEFYNKHKVFVIC